MLQRLCQRQYIVTRTDPGLAGYLTFKRLHDKTRPQMGGLHGLTDRTTRLGGLPHLSCKCKTEKIRVHIDRRATPPPCKQALTFFPVIHSVALLYGLPKYLIQRLQTVQNCAARLVSCKPRYARATPILRELHWLPVESRIILKILLLVYKSLNNLAPAYINSLLKNYKPSRNLRSVDQGLLTIPRSNQRTYGDRAFSVAAPKLWNALPLDIRNSGLITLFKCKLKTFLFKKYYL